MHRLIWIIRAAIHYRKEYQKVFHRDMSFSVATLIVEPLYKEFHDMHPGDAVWLTIRHM